MGLQLWGTTRPLLETSSPKKLKTQQRGQWNEVNLCQLQDRCGPSLRVMLPPWTHEAESSAVMSWIAVVDTAPGAGTSILIVHEGADYGTKAGTQDNS